MKAITKYWFLKGFNLFKKLGTLNMMKICEILEMNNIEKGQPIELNDEHKNSIFFLKRGSVKIVNNTYVTVKYVVKRGNIFGLRIQKLERRLHDLLYKDSTTRIREFRRVWLD